MKQINFFLAIAIIAVVLAFGNLVITLNKTGYIQTLTGFATTATTNLTIESGIAVNFTGGNVSWGTGKVDGGCTVATLTTNKSTYCGNWTDSPGYLVLENTGNQNISLVLNSSKNSTVFMGGTLPELYALVTDTVGNEGGCVFTNFTSYADLNGTSSTACDSFGYLASYDEIDINLNLTVPEDATGGSKALVLTAIISAV